MKFPIARDVFGSIDLKPAQGGDFQVKATAVVEETLRNATRLLSAEDGAVNSHAWRKLKRGDGLTMYRERSHRSTGARQRRGTFSSRKDALRTPPPPAFLVVGNVSASLDGLVFAISTATTEEQRIRSSYVSDGIVDCQLLSHITQPTKSTPHQYLNLQWLAMETKRVPFTQPRDFIVLNGAGIVDHRDREVGGHVGYTVRHSVQLSDTSPLQVVRGALSICGIYHELSPSLVHVYMVITIESRAYRAINSRLATALATNYAFAIHRVAEICQLKKLTTALLASERNCRLAGVSPLEAANPLGDSYASNATSVASTFRDSRLVSYPIDRCESCGCVVKWTPSPRAPCAGASSVATAACGNNSVSPAATTASTAATLVLQRLRLALRALRHDSSGDEPA